MTLQKIIKNSGPTFDFTNYKVQVGTTVSTIINYNVTGYGLAVADSAVSNTIYDTGILPASGTITVAPGTPLTFPFINKTPAQYFDAIVLLIIDGVRYPQGFSSSPDNLAAAVQRTTPTNKNLYWADLYCMGLQNSPGYSTVNNLYMFGGSGIQSASLLLNIHFSEPTPSSVSVTYKFSNYNYISGFTGMGTNTVVVPSGVLDFNLVARPGMYDIMQTFPNTGYDAGYFITELIINDPAYESLLPFYHSGRSN